jgi:acetate kinase
MTAAGDGDGILAVNGGSSSLKFAVRAADPPHALRFSGNIDRIGSSRPHLAFRGTAREVDARDLPAAGDRVLELLAETAGDGAIRAVGHRIVHGGPGHVAPERVTQALLDDLRGMSPFDPEHLPAEIALVERFRERLGDVPQVACFDTAFHADLPRRARILPLPRRYEAKGVRRYGFHGLSYAYLLEELERTAGAAAAGGRVILAHLGNGASLAAVLGKRSIDTTMAFTPASGLPMGTRSGDLDPGLVWYLARTEDMAPRDFQSLVHHRSGLLGISETASDVRDLLAAAGNDVRAAEAIEVFCYQTRKWIGAMAAALGGLDTLVFSGGIGENASEIRSRICRNLEFLGLELDAEANAENKDRISAGGSRVAVRIIPTDEELMIVRATHRTLEKARTS